MKIARPVPVHHPSPHTASTSQSLEEGLSVVVPTLNSQSSLRDLVVQLSRTLAFLAKRYELILVNDGSTDRTWDVICRLADMYPWIRGINLMRNYGQHNAVLCGIRAAQYDVTVTMDDDLQHPAEEIPRLLQKLTEGYDVVYGPPQAQQHGFFRDLASLATKWVLQGAMGAQIARDVTSFRALRTSLRGAFDAYVGPFANIDVLLTWSTRRFAAVRVAHVRRRFGRSNYGLRKLITHAMNMITGFSALPLQLASWVGFAFTLFGGAVLIFVLFSYFLRGVTVPGFYFLASVTSVLGGAQLFALGMIGEYLSRMHFRTMDKPCYVVRDAVTGEPAGEQDSSTLQNVG